MKRLWLLFAQAVTVTLAVWFVVGTLNNVRPDLLYEMHEVVGSVFSFFNCL